MTRKRYCNIRPTSLEEILETCNRHIKNITLTQLDYIEEGDGTPSDDFYCDMFRDVWLDMREDVIAMIAEKEKNDSNDHRGRPR